jgi:hypothetical protein
VVGATANSAAFRGVSRASYWQPFRDPVVGFHRRHSRRHPLDLNSGDPVELHVFAHHDREDVPSLSNVRVWHDEDLPAPTPAPREQPEPPPPIEPQQPDLEDRGLIRWNASTPERVYVTGAGVTPALIAEDLYGNASHATHIRAVWDDEERGESFTVNTELPVDFWVIIEYGYLRPEWQRRYNRSTTIIGRDIWGARPPIIDDPDRSYELYAGNLEDILDSIAIHHAGNAGYRTMNEVQNLHMDDKDRADIGYHFGINLSGGMYEGRPIGVKGAHIVSGNTGKIGIVLLADLDTQFFDDDDEITPAMERALLRLIHYLIGRYPRIRYLGGHREYNTGRPCPGDITMGRMSRWRSQTGLQRPQPVT